MTFSPVGIIIVFVVFGGLITGVIALLKVALMIPYAFICRIAKSKEFCRVWTIVCLAIAIVGTCILFWPPFALAGVFGIIAGIVLTGEFLGLAFLLYGGTVDTLEKREESRGMR